MPILLRFIHIYFHYTEKKAKWQQVGALENTVILKLGNPAPAASGIEWGRPGAPAPKAQKGERL